MYFLLTAYQNHNFWQRTIFQAMNLIDALNWNFVIVTSGPPHYYKCNGQAQKMVGIAKHILKITENCGNDLNTALLEYRWTRITELKYSSNFILRIKLPISKILVRPNSSNQQEFNNWNKKREGGGQKPYYNRNAKSKEFFNSNEVLMYKNKNCKEIKC